MSVQGLEILKGYITCEDPATRNKFFNLLDSFWHKADGKVLKEVQTLQDGTKNFIFKKQDDTTEVVSIPALPNTKPQSFITGLEEALGDRVVKVPGKGLSTNDLTAELYQKLVNLQNYVHPDFHQISEIENLPEQLTDIVTALENKQPIAPEGWGFSQQNYSSGEKEKLAGLGDPRWKGGFLSLEDLQTAWPEGEGQEWHNNESGWTADVDGGSRENVLRYIWDASDLSWQPQQGISTEETAASVKQKYESNPDTNAFTDDHKAAVDNLPERVVGNIPLVSGKIPVSQPDGSVIWEEKPTGTGGGTSRPNPLVVLNNYELTPANKDQLLRCENRTNILIKEGLGLDFRCIIKKATDISVGLVGSLNIVLETPNGYIAEILGRNDAIEIVCEKIENGIEYYGIYGALKEAAEIPYKTVLNIASTSTVSVAWPYLYKSSEWPEINTTKDYFLIYSSDHDTTSGGAIYWAECDSPELDGFVERGVIKNEYQSEFAWLIRIPTSESGLASDEIFLYYHTNTADPDNNGNQQTHLITTSGGDLDDTNIWTQRGKVLGIESGENHTGYLKVYKRGVGDYVGHHIVTGGTPRHEWVSTSPDGLLWTRDYEWDFNLYTPNGGAYGRSSVEPFNYNGDLHGFIDYRDGNGDKQLAIVKLDQDFQPIEFVKTVLIAEYEDKTVFIEDDIAYIYFRLGEVGTDQNPADYFLYKINILTL